MATKSKRPTAREQIKETVKEVRAANAKAHEERTDNCTAAAERTPLIEPRRLEATIPCASSEMVGFGEPGFRAA